MKIHLSFMAVVAVVALLLVVASTLPDVASAHRDIACNDDDKYTDTIDTTRDLYDVTTYDAPRFRNGSIAADGQLDIWVLEVTRFSSIRIGLRHLDFDADLRVYAGALRGGNLVKVRELARPGTQDEWGTVYLRPGHYCFAVEDGSGGSSSDTNSYVFRFSVHDARSNSNLSANAHNLGDLSQDGNAGKLKEWAKVNGKGPDYIDWYKFKLTGSNAKDVKLEAASLKTDPTIKLYQENCTTEVTGGTTSRASNGKSESVTFDSIAADTTYCASVESQIGTAYDAYMFRVYRNDP